MTVEHLDVLIVGAGLSGVGAAWRLQEELPGATFALLERREAIGGTWDLFRYPGVRSDSDMFTLAYPFRPWKGEKAIASGESIRTYIRDTADSAGITERIRFGTRVVRSSFSSETGRWTVETETADGSADSRSASSSRKTYTCTFLYTCCGYYAYDQGYQPEFPGREDFAGPLGAPAVLAGGPGVRRQEGRRGRQRCHRRHADPGHGRDRRARDDAAALAVVPDRAAVEGPGRGPAAEDPAPQGRARDPAHAVRDADPGLLPARPPPPGAREEAPARARRQVPQGPVLRGRALHADVRALGPAPVRHPRGRLLHRDPQRARVGGHRPHRPDHREGDPPALRRGDRGGHHRLGDRAVAAAVGRHGGRASTASRSTSATPSPTAA